MDKEYAEKVLRYGQRAMELLEADGMAINAKGLGPALIIVGLSLSAKNGEKKQAMNAVYSTAVKTGLAPSMEELSRSIKSDPEKLAQFLATLTGGKLVRMPPVQEARSKDAGGFPWFR